MSIILISSHLFLFVCALFLAGRSYKTGEENDHTASMVISLSAAFIACAAVGNLLLQQTDQDIQTLQRILDNLAYYAAIPLIASALLDNAWKFEWSKAAWGRWLLVLFALFELCRRSDIGALYSQVMAALSVAVMLISVLRSDVSSLRIAGCAAAASLASALFIYGPYSLIADSIDPATYSVTLGVSLGLLSLAFTPKKSQ